MKKILLALGIFIAIGGVLVPVHQAYAATDAQDEALCEQNPQMQIGGTTCTYKDPDTGITYQGSYFSSVSEVGSSDSWSFTKTAPNGAQTTLTNATAYTAGNTLNVQTDANGIQKVAQTSSPLGGATAQMAKAAAECAAAAVGTDFFGIGLVLAPDCLLQSAIGVVMFINAIVNGLLFVITGLFSGVIDTLVMHMGSLIDTSVGGSNGIQAAWQIVRDLANIAIIGGLIATAISTILQVQNYSANKYLARLIIAALLVNFSYFFAGAIIDSSNFLATQFYNNLICNSATDCSSASISDRFDGYIINGSLDENSAGVFTSLFPTITSVVTQKPNQGIIDLVTQIGMLVALLVTIFIYLSAIILLLGRFAALIFLLISSPVGIAATAVPIPGVSKYAREWWGILFSQAFFAPVLFLLMGLSLIMLDGLSTALKASAETGTTVSNSFGSLLTIFVAVAFMLISLRVAKKMSESGKDYFGDIYKGAEKIMGTPLNLYKYGLQSVATETVGRGAYRAKKFYDEKIAPKPWIFGLRADQIPLIATVDRKLSKGLSGLTEAKFGGKESYEDTRKKRDERTKYVTGQQEQQDKLRKDAELKKQEDQAQAQYDELAAEQERETVPAGSSSAPPEGGGTSGGGGGTSSGGTPGGTSAGTPSEGGASPAERKGTGGESAPSGGGAGGGPSGVQGAGESQTKPGEGTVRVKGQSPAATKTPGKQEETQESRPVDTSPAHADVPQVVAPPNEEESEGRAEVLGLQMLERRSHRAEYVDENGKVVGEETVQDARERLEQNGIKPSDLVRKDEKTGKWVEKTPLELAQEFGDRIALEAPDAARRTTDSEGNPRKEDEQQLSYRLGGDRRGFIRVKPKN